MVVLSAELNQGMDILTDLLKRDYVHIKCKKSVDQKLIVMKHGGAKNLQVIADFDFTLTKFQVNGMRTPSTYGVVENYSRWPTRFKEEIKLLKIQYNQIDNYSKKTVEEKLPVLMEIFKVAFKVMSKSRLKDNDFKNMVEESSLQLRDGLEDFLKDLSVARVPVLILSAGLKNVIVKVLSKYGLLDDTLKIVANHLQCEVLEDESESDYEGPLVHPYNKDVISSCLSDSYFTNFSNRKNVLVLGDSLEDLYMSKGIPYAKTVLTIGYFNNQVEKSLTDYQDRYDIVIVDDQTMDIPHAIIELVTDKKG